MLDLPPPAIARRIADRAEMGIYESKKCLEYFSYVYLELAAFYGMTVVDVSPSPKEVASKIVEMVESGSTK
jgi:thymidylate kinase